MTAELPVRKPAEDPVLNGADGNQAETLGADVEAPERFKEAVIAARKLLIDTVDAVDPETPPEELLRVVTNYRACLAELVAVLPVPESGDSA